jgi:hypothetical protein
VTSEIEDLMDRISRTYIAAIKERVLRDSAIRVQEIIERAAKLVRCGFCHQILEIPVTLVSCLHSICHVHRFDQMEGPVCPVYGEHSARTFVDNSLAIIVSKFIYIKDVMQLLGK